MYPALASKTQVYDPRQDFFMGISFFSIFHLLKTLLIFT